MKKIFAAGLLVGALAAGLAFAADSTDQKISQDTNDLKKDYAIKVHRDLKKINAKIYQLKQGLKKDGKTADADFKRQVKNLEIQKAGVDKKLVELEKSTGDAWKDLRQGVDGAVADLRKSVDGAVNQFKQKK